MLSCDDAGPGSILAREDFFFLNNAFNFHRAYTLPGFINFILQRGKTYTLVGSTWDSNIIKVKLADRHINAEPKLLELET